MVLDNALYHTTDRLEERGVERGSTQRSALRGWERAIGPTLELFQGQHWGTPERRGGAYMDLIERIDTILN